MVALRTARPLVQVVPHTIEAVTMLIKWAILQAFLSQ